MMNAFECVVEAIRQDLAYAGRVVLVCTLGGLVLLWWFS